MSDRPVVDLLGPDGDAFMLASGIATGLRDRGAHDEAAALMERFERCLTYAGVLDLCAQWVDYKHDPRDWKRRMQP